MQGASILAASKLFETEVNRSSTNFISGTVSRNAFKDCLKSQSRQIAGSEPESDKSMAGTSQAGIKSAKLDRSTLLKTPSSPNGNQSKDMHKDDSRTQNDSDALEKSSEPINAINGSEGGTGQTLVVNGTPDNPARADTANNQVEEAAMVQAITQSGDSPPASGLAQLSNNSAVEAMEGLNDPPVEIKAAGEQLAADTGINNKIDIQPQSVSAQPGSQALAMASDFSQPDPEVKGDNQTIQLKPLAQPVQSNQVLISGAENAGQTLAEQPQANPDAAAYHNITTNEASPQVETAETPSAKAPTETANTAVAAAEVAASAIPNNGTSDTKGRVNQTSPEIDDEAPPTGTKTDNKAEKISTKIPTDVKNALNDKLEESAAKSSSGLLDNKASINNGELKKIIEFESNRLHTTRLASNSGELVKADQAETPQMSGITPRVDSLITSSLNKTMAADFTGKAPIDLKNIIDQVVQKAELLVKNNSSEMKIQLQPEFLGKMTIKIAMEDGLLTARFITDNNQVKHLLDNNLASLRQSLEAQGIKVERTEVNVQLDSGGTFGGYQEGRQELWQRPDSPFYQGNHSFENNGYTELADEEMPQPVLNTSDYYGINQDGSMNLVV